MACCDKQYEAMIADGLPVERYDGSEGKGLLFPSDGRFNPLMRTRLLAHKAIKSGARLHGRTSAVDVSGTMVKTGDGHLIKCRRVIVAVDGRLEVILPELKERVRTTRLQMLATAPASDVVFPRPVYRRYGYDYWQQLPDGSLALGGFRDLNEDGEWTT